MLHVMIIGAAKTEVSVSDVHTCSSLHSSGKATVVPIHCMQSTQLLILKYTMSIFFIQSHLTSSPMFISTGFRMTLS